MDERQALLFAVLLLVQLSQANGLQVIQSESYLSISCPLSLSLCWLNLGYQHRHGQNHSALLCHCFVNAKHTSLQSFYLSLLHVSFKWMHAIFCVCLCLGFSFLANSSTNTKVLLAVPSLLLWPAQITLPSPNSAQITALRYAACTLFLQAPHPLRPPQQLRAQSVLWPFKTVVRACSAVCVSPLPVVHSL